MKRLLLVCSLGFIFFPAISQITITASDMPVAGDTLRHSIVSPIGSGIDLTKTGANYSWDFGSLFPIAQAVDSYQLASSVNSVFALLISPTASGYKVADSLGGSGISIPLPIKVTDIYTFFDQLHGPDRYVADAFAATISGFPVPVNYTDDDVIYTFPLKYNNTDSNSYLFDLNVPSVARIKMQGYRRSVVDGWGTIKTPYFTTAVNCIRVRSDIHELDTFSYSGTTIGLPRHTVEYKWLVSGEHYPALYVTTNIVAGLEVPTSVTFRDHYRHTILSVANTKPTIQFLNAYPNPAKDGNITIDIPNNWKDYFVEIFDMSGKLISNYNNRNRINIQSLANGLYIARITSGLNIGYVRIEKQD